jgi:hypothetical protein
MALPGFLVLLIRFNRYDLVRIQEALSERRQSLSEASASIEVPVGAQVIISPSIAAQ